MNEKIDETYLEWAYSCFQGVEITEEEAIRQGEEKKDSPRWTDADGTDVLRERWENEKKN